MNITVINAKDIFKYAIKIGIIIFAIYICIHLCGAISNIRQNKLKEQIEENISKINESSFLGCIDKTISLMSYKKGGNDQNEILSSNKILAMGAGIFDESILEKTDLIINAEELTIDDTEELVKQIEDLPENVKTEAVTENNITPRYTTAYQDVQINNQSDYELTEEMLVPDAEITNKKNILIYHTHTCESYTASEGYEYEATGNYRTTDLNYSVARVGTELTAYLENKGFNVTHNTTYHDYPSYSGSYDRSLETIKDLLMGSDTQLVIDLHRDAVGSSSSYAPTVKINDKYAAQMMFVIGTDGGGLEHPNWTQNLKIAIKIQKKANEMYPGLFRPVIVRNSRYNQHLTTGSSIIEVGATGNTMDQCILSMQCLANVLEAVCK